MKLPELGPTPRHLQGNDDSNALGLLAVGALGSAVLILAGIGLFFYGLVKLLT